MQKHPHITVIVIDHQDYGKGHPGWHARFVMTNAHNSAHMFVEGPNVNSPAWGGDIHEFPFPNPCMAWKYALVFGGL